MAAKQNEATVSADPIGVRMLVTTAHPSMHEHTLDGRIHPNLGRLIQPRHTSSIELTAAAGITWAADNDCFQGLDEPAFVRMIDRLVGLEGCRFVTVPDVVGDAEATLESFDHWIGELDRRGLPAALVLQDGLEAGDPRIPWDRIAAVFVGGTDDFKDGPVAAAIALEAKARGKWVHWGRVNTRRRFDLIVATGAVDSFDGSKWARFRKTYLDDGLSWCRETSADFLEVVATVERRFPLFDIVADLEDGSTMLLTIKTAADYPRQKGETMDELDDAAADEIPEGTGHERPYRFTVDTPAVDETDAAIVADVIVGAVRDERNDPDVPVAVDFEPILDDVPPVEVVLFDKRGEVAARATCFPADAAVTGRTLWNDLREKSVATGGGGHAAPARLRYYVDGRLVRSLDGPPYVAADPLDRLARDVETIAKGDS